MGQGVLPAEIVPVIDGERERHQIRPLGEFRQHSIRGWTGGTALAREELHHPEGRGEEGRGEERLRQESGKGEEPKLGAKGHGLLNTKGRSRETHVALNGCHLYP
jgi:hypothetical protein